jgi:hypothetical protein
LPERLHDLLAQTTVLQGGQQIPLLRSERELLPEELPEPRTAAPNWQARYCGIGIVLGCALAWLGLNARTNAAARAALHIANIALGVPLGLLGCALCYLTFFSAHSAAAANYNVLSLPPWVLALGFPGLAASRNRDWAWRLARLAAAGACSSTLLALGIHALSRYPQANGQELAFALPLWLGAAVAAHLASKAVPLAAEPVRTRTDSDTPG